MLASRRAIDDDLPGMSAPRKNPYDPRYYATNEEFRQFFAGHGILVEHVTIDPIAHQRCFNVVGHPPMTLEMDDSAEECLRKVKAQMKR